MLATITPTPTKIVQAGAPTASTTPVISQAHANTKVAIAGRASWDTLGLASAIARVSESTKSANRLNGMIEGVIGLDH